MHPLALLMMIFLAMSLAIEWYLSIRQQAHLLAGRDQVPARFADEVSLAEHRKAVDYALAKLRLARWGWLWQAVLLLGWTLGGGLDALDTWVRETGWSQLVCGVAVMVAYFVFAQLFELPLQAWAVFGVETRFGFNRMSLGLFVGDQVKQGVLLVLLGAPLAWVMLWLMHIAGGNWWWLAWAVWTLFSLFLLWAFPTLIAPLFNRFEPLPEGELKARIQALLDRCGFTASGLYVMDGSRRSAHGNAYFTGFGRAKRIVFFDTLLERLEADEVCAVLAHELGHFRAGHVRKRWLFVSILSLFGFALLGAVADMPWFYHALGVTHPSPHMALLLFVLTVPVFFFWVGPLGNALSRRHEFEADAYAVAHANGARLISALVKMYRDNAAPLDPDAWYSAWHDSHPPAMMRIAHIERALRAQGGGHVQG